MMRDFDLCSTLSRFPISIRPGEKERRVTCCSYINSERVIWRQGCKVIPDNA